MIDLIINAITWEDKKLKNKFKFFLVFANMLLVIFFFEQSVSSICFASNMTAFNSYNTNENTTSDEGKVVYLTFDDGPSKNRTDEVLDILKENDVKATFFLIGNQIEGLEDVVKRIYDEGHSIGLHTYTHKFKNIYCNQDKFIQEMCDCRNEINKVIGISPNIIRFPGGSSKHLSDNYLNRLHNNKFKIYDWNVETSDGLNPKLSPSKMYRKAIKESKNLQSIIILMHCDCRQRNTCKVLPEIIKYYKSQGYEFKTITEETPELYFPIKVKR